MSIRSQTIARIGLSVLSGVALGLSFPKFDLNLLAWVAFIPLLYSIDGESLRATFIYGWIAGFACYIVSLYWITITLNTFAGLPVVIAILPMLLLSGILAIYTGAALWASAFTAARTRISMVVALPVIWTGIEWLRSFFPIGFPWSYVGYSQYSNLELIQFAEITGVYGVSALIVFFNVVLYAVLFGRHSRRFQVAALGTLTALLIAADIFGTVRIRQLEHAPAAGEIRAAMVQGDIPQSVKWSPDFLETSFGVYVAQSEKAAREGAQVIIWPEAAAAFLFQPQDRYPAQLAADANYRSRLLDLARATAKPILFGAPAVGVEDGEPGFYNRAYLVSGKGEVESYYDKMQLVPFGEYIPLRPLLGKFVHRIVAGFGDMFPGRVQTIFNVDGARMAVLICYESVFPDLTRRAVKRGAEILVNITNDAWYGESSAPYQLLAMAAMRSVETKVPMIRVANTGISAVITPTGRITASTPLSIRTMAIETVEYRRERTIYTVVGDLFAEVCFALGVAWLLWSICWPVAPRRRDTSPPVKRAAANGRPN
jgi:apolipoprotein N-acyltransferase